LCLDFLITTSRQVSSSFTNRYTIDFKIYTKSVVFWPLKVLRSDLYRPEESEQLIGYAYYQNIDGPFMRLIGPFETLLLGFFEQPVNALPKFHVL
jgi:hypothetical protein